MNESDNFWSWYNNITEQPIDTIVLGAKKDRNPITPDLVWDYYEGVGRIFEIVNVSKPDIVFFPLRGASPLKWCLDEMGDIRMSKTPLFIELRLGHTNVVESSQEFGTKNSKRAIIQWDLDNSPLKPDVEQKVMLIDEVQSGSTLTAATMALLEELVERGITDTIEIVAAEDSRVDRQPARSYIELKNNSCVNLTSVALPLFHIDREELLDFQLATTPGHGQSTSREHMLVRSHIMRNTEAERMYRILCQAYLHPYTLHNSLENGAVGEYPNKIDIWLREILTNPQVGERRAERNDILSWLSEFARICISKCSTVNY